MADGDRWEGREFSGGGNVAVVRGDVRRQSPRPLCVGAEEVGIAPVRREEAIMLQHRA